jgi:hypothetical protein
MEGTNPTNYYDCYAFNDLGWGVQPQFHSTAPSDNIEPNSEYKIWFDKNFRRYYENPLVSSPTTAPIHLRNVTHTLLIHKNNFTKIYSIAGGSVYINGFNNTFSKRS